jgi:hypothetical protein
MKKDIDILHSGEVIRGVTILNNGLRDCIPGILVF